MPKEQSSKEQSSNDISLHPPLLASSSSHSAALPTWESLEFKDAWNKALLPDGSPDMAKRKRLTADWGGKCGKTGPAFDIVVVRPSSSGVKKINLFELLKSMQVFLPLQEKKRRLPGGRGRDVFAVISNFPDTQRPLAQFAKSLQSGTLECVDVVLDVTHLFEDGAYSFPPTGDEAVNATRSTHITLSESEGHGLTPELKKDCITLEEALKLNTQFRFKHTPSRLLMAIFREAKNQCINFNAQDVEKMLYDLNAHRIYELIIALQTNDTATIAYYIQDKAHCYLADINASPGEKRAKARALRQAFGLSLKGPGYNWYLELEKMLPSGYSLAQNAEHCLDILWEAHADLLRDVLDTYSSQQTSSAALSPETIQMDIARATEDLDDALESIGTLERMEEVELRPAIQKDAPDSVFFESPEQCEQLEQRHQQLARRHSTKESKPGFPHPLNPDCMVASGKTKSSLKPTLEKLEKLINRYLKPGPSDNIPELIAEIATILEPDPNNPILSKSGIELKFSKLERFSTLNRALQAWKRQPARKPSEDDIVAQLMKSEEEAAFQLLDAQAEVDQRSFVMLFIQATLAIENLELYTPISKIYQIQHIKLKLNEIKQENKDRLLRTFLGDGYPFRFVSLWSLRYQSASAKSIMLKEVERRIEANMKQRAQALLPVLAASIDWLSMKAQARVYHQDNERLLSVNRSLLKLTGFTSQGSSEILPHLFIVEDKPPSSEYKCIFKTRAEGITCHFLLGRPRFYNDEKEYTIDKEELKTIDARLKKLLEEHIEHTLSMLMLIVSEEEARQCIKPGSKPLGEIIKSPEYSLLEWPKSLSESDRAASVFFFDACQINLNAIEDPYKKELLRDLITYWYEATDIKDREPRKVTKRFIPVDQSQDDPGNKRIGRTFQTNLTETDLVAMRPYVDLLVKYKDAVNISYDISSDEADRQDNLNFLRNLLEVVYKYNVIYTSTLSTVACSPDDRCRDFTALFQALVRTDIEEKIKRLSLAREEGDIESLAQAIIDKACADGSPGLTGSHPTDIFHLADRVWKLQGVLKPLQSEIQRTEEARSRAAATSLPFQEIQHLLEKLLKVPNPGAFPAKLTEAQKEIVKQLTDNIQQKLASFAKSNEVIGKESQSLLCVKNMFNRIHEAFYDNGVHGGNSYSSHSSALICVQLLSGIISTIVNPSVSDTSRELALQTLEYEERDFITTCLSGAVGRLQEIRGNIDPPRNVLLDTYLNKLKERASEFYHRNTQDFELICDAHDMGPGETAMTEQRKTQWLNHLGLQAVPISGQPRFTFKNEGHLDQTTQRFFGTVTLSDLFCDIFYDIKAQMQTLFASADQVGILNILKNTGYCHSVSPNLFMPVVATPEESHQLKENYSLTEGFAKSGFNEQKILEELPDKIVSFFREHQCLLIPECRAIELQTDQHLTP